MPPEILALIDKPLSLFVVLFVGAMFGMVIEQIVTKGRREAWKRKNAWRWRKDGDRPGSAGRGATDAAAQLRIVMAAEFSVQPVLNRAEARLFRELDRLVLARAPGWQVMAQVSLGEILRSPNRDAYGCINSKRIDLLLMDEECRPRHVIEYQGTGHHIDGNAAAARDAVKKEALRKAGIDYHEVQAGAVTPADLGRLVDRLTNQSKRSASVIGTNSSFGKAAPHHRFAAKPPATLSR